MTITYTDKVSNAKLCAFSRLLLHWKGSIYKLMYKEMLIFCFLYVSLSLLYRLILSDEGKRVFEKIALHCESFINLIPLSFVLGFYVNLIVGRWWNQYLNIPWPDRMMMYLTSAMSGKDEQSRMMRRTLMRYMTLGSIIVFQATSVRVKKRFPTMDHLIEAGIITHEEVKALDEVSTPHGKWWVPFVWSSNMVRDALDKGLIPDTYLYKTIMEEILAYRGFLGLLYSYDWISVPLVYTQVTTLAVYTFFLGCTLGRQFLDPAQKYPGHDVDLYVPLFTLLQFFFYMGWLKVAEQLINPFGEDDDDFEMNWIIDRNMQVSLLSVDNLHGQYPTLTKDLYYGESPPDYLPYTKSSSKHISLPHMGSTSEIRISDEGMKLLTPMETIQEGVELGHTVTRNDSGINTPITFSHKHQNLMSGTKSPVLFSRVSLQSSDDGRFLLGSSLVNKAKEKLGRWLYDQSSQTELHRLSSYHHNNFRHSSIDSTETLPSDILNEQPYPQFHRLPILPEYRNGTPPLETNDTATTTKSTSKLKNSFLTSISAQPSNNVSQIIHPPLASLPSYPGSNTHTTPNSLLSSKSRLKKPSNIFFRLSSRCPRTHSVSLNPDSRLNLCDLQKPGRSSFYRQRYNNRHYGRDFDSQTLYDGSVVNVNEISAPSLPCVAENLKSMKSPYFMKKPLTSLNNPVSSNLAPNSPTSNNSTTSNLTTNVPVSTIVTQASIPTNLEETNFPIYQPAVDQKKTDNQNTVVMEKQNGAADNTSKDVLNKEGVLVEIDDETDKKPNDVVININTTKNDPSVEKNRKEENVDEEEEEEEDEEEEEEEEETEEEEEEMEEEDIQNKETSVNSISASASNTVDNNTSELQGTESSSGQTSNIPYHKIENVSSTEVNPIKSDERTIIDKKKEPSNEDVNQKTVTSMTPLLSDDQ